MNPRSVIILLAGLGAVLLLAIARVKMAAPLPVWVAPEVPTGARDAHVQPDPTIEGTQSGSRAKPPSPRFRWSQVESSDYRQYIANLRATGCPEPTLQDIIVADVNKLYEPRETPFKAQLAGFNLRQWNYPSLDPGYSKQEFAARKQLREVELEKQAVIKELLGIEIPLDPIRAWHPRSYERYESAPNTVPPAKRELVRQIQENYWETSDQLNDKYGLRRTPEYLEEYKRINAQRKAQLQQVLTAQEQEDYEMRTTGIASRLGTYLSGTGVTEDEFREIFRLKNDIDAPYGGSVRVDMTEAGVTPEYLQSQQAVEQKIAEVLGPDRYAAYQRAQDPAYQRLADLGERFGLDQDKVIAAYQLQREIGQQRFASSADPRMLSRYGLLPGGAPQNAIAAAERYKQNQEGLKMVLGETAFNALQQGENLRLLEQSFLP